MGFFAKVKAAYDLITIKELMLVMLVLLGLILVRLGSINAGVSAAAVELGQVRWAIDAQR